MGRKREDKTLETSNRNAVRDGVTYAEAQKRETQSEIGQVRIPRAEDGGKLYMTSSAWNALKGLGRKEKGNEKIDRNKQ